MYYVLWLFQNLDRQSLIRMSGLIKHGCLQMLVGYFVKLIRKVKARNFAGCKYTHVWNICVVYIVYSYSAINADTRILHLVGHDVFNSGNNQGSTHLQHSALSATDLDSYRNGVFALLVYIPIVCAFIQVSGSLQLAFLTKK